MKRFLALLLLASLHDAAWSQNASDALQALEQRKKALLIQQTTEIGRYLKEQQSLCMKRGDLAAANALQALLDDATRRFNTLQSGNLATEAQPDAKAQFVQRLKDKYWELPEFKNPRFTVRIEGANILWRDEAGADKHILHYTIIWPGLLKVEYSSGKVAYYAFSQDLSKLWILTATAEFPGELVAKP